MTYFLFEGLWMHQLNHIWIFSQITENVLWGQSRMGVIVSADFAQILGPSSLAVFHKTVILYKC